jgi:hypothetical protein
MDLLELRTNTKTALHSLLFHIALVLSIYAASSFIKRADVPIKFAKLDWKIPTTAVFGVIPLYFINREILSANFTGDELAYLQNSFGYSSMISQKLYGVIPQLTSITPLFLLQILNSISTLVFVAIIYVTIKYRLNLKPVTLIILVLLLRVANDLFFNFGSAYPNLYGSLLQLLSPVASLPTLFRISHWLLVGGLVLFIFNKYWSTSSKMTAVFSVFGLSALGLSTSWTALDPSVFFILCGYTVMTLLIKKPEKYFSICILVITLATFVRATSIVMLPIVMLISVREIKRERIALYGLIPAILLIPYLIEAGYQNVVSQIQGTRYSDVAIFSTHDSSLLTLLKSISLQFNAISQLSVALLLLALLTVRNTRAVIAFYLLIIIPTYAAMIPNATQGLNKYAIEIVTPVIFVGMSMLFERSSLINRRGVVVSALILGSYLTTVQLSTIRNLDEKMDGWKQAPLVINYPVENDEAYEFIQLNFATNACYNPGTTYGVFPFVLANFEKSQLEELSEVFNRNKQIFGWGSKTVFLDELVADCLIVDNFPIKAVLESELKVNGWEVVYSKDGKQLGSSVAIWVKASS